EPRLETLRDRPEISPWSLSGKLDWTTLTEEVSIVPIPMPNRSSPGIQRQEHADGGNQEPGDDQPSLRVPPGEPPGGGRGGQDPDRGRGEHQAGLDRAVVVDLLQVDGDGEEGSLQDQP